MGIERTNQSPCANCGEPLSTTTRFCSNCGSENPVWPPPPSTSRPDVRPARPAPRAPRPWYWFLAEFVAGVAVGGLAYYLTYAINLLQPWLPIGICVVGFVVSVWTRPAFAVGLLLSGPLVVVGMFASCVVTAFLHK